MTLPEKNLKNGELLQPKTDLSLLLGTKSQVQSSLVELQAQLYAEVRAHGRPVRQLLTALLDRRNLAAAWERVRSTEGANTPGVDGVTCKDLEQAPHHSAVDRFLSRLTEELLQGKYRPQPIRWVEVPKSSGGVRRLGILCVRDRVVQAALKQVLEPILEPAFLPSSFGFRPGRSVAAALQTALSFLQPDGEGHIPYPYGVHLDVADCFDTVDHLFLMQALTEHVADTALLQLLHGVLRAGGRRVYRWFRPRQVGLVQGSPLSPLLCNLALHPLDQALATMHSATQGGVRLLRYADDLLLLARTPKLAHKALALCRRVLSHLGQRFRDRQAPILSFQEGVTWLGVHLRVTANRWTHRLQPGYVIPDDKVLEMLQRLTEMTTPPSSKLSTQTFDLGQWILSLNQQLREWYQAYLYADNLPEVARTLDEHVLARFEELLHAVTGKRRAVLHREYRQRLPRGFWTWQVEGTRLVVLSALAPRRPHRLLIPPPWQAGPAPLAAPAAPQAAAPVLPPPLPEPTLSSPEKGTALPQTVKPPATASRDPAAQKPPAEPTA
jgi:RNA-directed DNA polymerase